VAVYSTAAKRCCEKWLASTVRKGSSSGSHARPASRTPYLNSVLSFSTTVSDAAGDEKGDGEREREREGGIPPN
jgi:hypothetical protein